MEDLTLPIRLNVGGSVFMTRARTLQSLPDSRLAELDKLSPEYDLSTDTYYYDRNPVIFQHILECYRTGELHLPPNQCTESVRRELDFWGIDTDSVLSPCCMGQYQDNQDRNQTMKRIYKTSLDEMKDLVSEEWNLSGSKRVKLRQRIWTFLEFPTTTAAKIWICLYSVFVLASLVLYVLITCPSHIHLRRDTSIKIPGSLLGDTSTADNAFQLDARIILMMDIVLNLIFSAELTLRVFSSKNRGRYLRSVSTMIEVLCTSSYWIYIITISFIPMDKMGPNLILLMDSCLLIQVLRLVRVLRLSRTIVELRALVLSLKHSLFEIAIIMLMILSAVFFYSVVMHYVEWGADKDEFSSIPKALWWAINAVTAVGYGDVTPKTHAGYVVGAMCALSGVLLTGLSVSILSNNLQLYYQYARTQTRVYKMLTTRTMNTGPRIMDKQQVHGDFVLVQRNGQ